MLIRRPGPEFGLHVSVGYRALAAADNLGVVGVRVQSPTHAAYLERVAIAVDLIVG